MTSDGNHIHFSEQSRQKLLDNFCLWDGLVITANQPLSLTLIPIWVGYYIFSWIVCILSIQRHLFCIFISCSEQQITKYDKKDDIR